MKINQFTAHLENKLKEQKKELKKLLIKYQKQRSNIVTALSNSNVDLIGEEIDAIEWKPLMGSNALGIEVKVTLRIIIPRMTQEQMQKFQSSIESIYTHYNIFDNRIILTYRA